MKMYSCACALLCNASCRWTGLWQYRQLCAPTVLLRGNIPKPSVPTSGDSSVGIVIRYGLGIECRWRQDFPRPSKPALGPNQPPSHTMGTGSFPGVKRSGRGVDHPPHLAPRLKKEESCTSTPTLGPRGLF